MEMSREIKPYKRNKGSLKQKRNLESFNIFTDELICHYFGNTNEVNNNIGKDKKSKNFEIKR